MGEGLGDDTKLSWQSAEPHIDFSLPSPGEADFSAVRGLSSAMGIGMSLLLQISLTSGDYPSVGQSRRCSRSIPRSIPQKELEKASSPALQSPG